MLPFVLHQVTPSVIIDCELRHKVCHFTDDSGAGKTWLFNLLNSYCELEGIPYALVNYVNAREGVSSLIENCSGKQIVFLDNADLYDYKAILTELSKQDCIVLVSYHELAGIVSPEDWDYTVSIDKGVLRVRPVEAKL